MSTTSKQVMDIKTSKGIAESSNEQWSHYACGQEPDAA